MPTDPREFYRVLELSPGASLEEIKRSYRLLLQRWHPDRYKPGSVMQTTAEDVTKELNEAYNQLCRKKRYLEFRPKPARGPVKTGTTGDPWKRPARHGWKVYQDAAPPPRATAERPRPPPPPNPPPAPANPPPPPPSATPPPQAKAPEPVPEKPRRRRGAPLPWRAFAAAGLVATTLFLFARWLETLAAAETPVSTFTARPHAVTAPRATAAMAPTATARLPAPAPVPPPTEVTRPELVFAAPAEAWRVEFASPTLRQWSSSSRAGAFGLPEPAGRAAFSVRFGRRKAETNYPTEEAWSLLDTFAPGDSKARVLAVQGEPDEAGVNVFRYGSSLVYFEEGRVTHWSEGRPALHVLVLPHFEFNGLARFGVGSTRSEVTRIQGEPTQTTANAFYYGASAVYFDRDWVTGWSEVDQPLRARPTVTLAAMLASPSPGAGVR